MNELAVQDAVAKLQMFVEADGAEIEIEQLDSSTGRVSLRLDFSRVECLDCVMPPEVLVEIIEKRIRLADASVASVSIADPRNEVTSRES
jgi:hypothetical protein